MNLENIWQVKYTRHKRTNINIIWYLYHLFEVPRRVKFLETEVEWWFSGAGEGGEAELLFNVYRLSVWGDENVLETDGGWQQPGSVNVLGITELYTLKWLKRLILCYVYFTTHKIILYTLTHPSCYCPTDLLVNVPLSSCGPWDSEFPSGEKVSRRHQQRILRNVLTNQLFTRVKVILTLLLIPLNYICLQNCLLVKLLIAVHTIYKISRAIHSHFAFSGVFFGGVGFKWCQNAGISQSYCRFHSRPPQ